jgi:hypothetical protein
MDSVLFPEEIKNQNNSPLGEEELQLKIVDMIYSMGNQYNDSKIVSQKNKEIITRHERNERYKQYISQLLFLGSFISLFFWLVI